MLHQPLFRGLSNNAITIMLPIVIPLEFAEGTLLCRVNDETSDAYISRTGILTLLTIEGRILRRLRSSKVFDHNFIRHYYIGHDHMGHDYTETLLYRP